MVPGSFAKFLTHPHNVQDGSFKGSLMELVKERLAEEGPQGPGSQVAPNRAGAHMECWLATHLKRLIRWTGHSEWVQKRPIAMIRERDVWGRPDQLESSEEFQQMFLVGEPKNYD